MDHSNKPNVIVLASHNKHKASEIQDIIGTTVHISTLADYPAHDLLWDETGDTFEENARIKGRLVRSALGKPVLADDSGLVVEALNGRPGVLSSSFGGVEGDHERNTRRLLEELRNSADPNRRAAFVCCLLYIDQDGQETFFYGRCEGTIISEVRGTGGFGYDPIFVPDGFNQTFSELGASTKNSISHRRAALALFQEFLLK